MLRFNTAPVPEERIEMITKLLNDPLVGEAWLAYTTLGQMASPTVSFINARDKAWREYARLRDEYLKLPPLVIPIMQGTQNRYRN